MGPPQGRPPRQRRGHERALLDAAPPARGCHQRRGGQRLRPPGGRDAGPPGGAWRHGLANRPAGHRLRGASMAGRWPRRCCPVTTGVARGRPRRTVHDACPRGRGTARRGRGTPRPATLGRDGGPDSNRSPVAAPVHVAIGAAAAARHGRRRGGRRSWPTEPPRPAWSWTAASSRRPRSSTTSTRLCPPTIRCDPWGTDGPEPPGCARPATPSWPAP